MVADLGTRDAAVALPPASVATPTAPEGKGPFPATSEAVLAVTAAKVDVMGTLVPVASTSPVASVAPAFPGTAHDVPLAVDTRVDEATAVAGANSIVRPRPVPATETVRPGDEACETALGVLVPRVVTGHILPHDPAPEIGTGVDRRNAGPAKVVRLETPSAPVDTRNASRRPATTGLVGHIPVLVVHVDAA